MKTAANKLDCFVRVVTPENIEFEYALAGPFQRLPAFLLDFAIRLFVFLVLIFVGSVATAWLPVNSTIFIIVLILVFFLFSWFYGLYFEARFNGRTLGKMAFRLRVISVDGRPINGTQAALRNFLRLSDMGMPLSIQIFSAEAPPAYIIPTFLIGMVSMVLSRRLQRLGDLAAGTMVVSEGRRRSPWNLQPDDLRAFGLAELIPATYQPSSSLAQTIGLYMENRKRLSPLRRNEIAKHLAEPLLKEFGLMADTSTDLLLCAMYVKIYLSEDQRSAGREKLRQVTQRPSPPLAPTGLA